MRFLQIFLGNILITGAYAFITVPNEIINGGITSFAMVLHQMMPMCSISLLVNGMTLLLLILCRIFLGKEYFGGALFSAIAYMICFSFFSSLSWSVALPRVACVFLAAFLVGTGYAICIHARSTAVGFDTIALILNRYWSCIPVAGSMFCINTTILLLGIALYGWSAILLGILFVLLQSYVLHGWMRYIE